TLQFTEPAANALTALSGTAANHTLGEEVRIAWQTGYELTTLRVWQGPRADGSLVGEVLAANQTQDETSFTWMATSIGGLSLTRPFRFELTDAEGTSSADSSTFYVVRSTASTSTSRMSSASTSPTSSAASSTTTDVAAAATTPAPPSTDQVSHRRALDLGLGLGLGIPFMLALLGLCAFCLIRRRKNKRRSANLPRGHQPQISISKPLMIHQDKPGLPDSPGHPQIAYFGSYTPGRYENPGRHETRDRSSNGTTSTAGTVASSYHGPFPFERPESHHDEFDHRHIEQEFRAIPRGPVGVASSIGSGSGGASQRTGTPRSDHNNGVARMPSIDEEDGPTAFRPPGTPPQWPLRS
ncbi:hypothetical protein LTR53_016810, partial [Teratosphaeriaceae sp. CCFEE 6253]